MNVLILGGTGAMGVPLTKILSNDNHVFITTRKDKESIKNITYLKGNARNKDFLDTILCLRKWDAIIDFMVRPYDELEKFLPALTSNTKQYIFISSARVYAQCDDYISEESPRLLNVCTDEEYLKTNEYALAKAREEDLLFNRYKNFTIVRPSITYNNYRLQLGVFEKEEWLYRALHGRTIVFSEDIGSKLTTNTSGDDVAKGIAALIGKEDATGQAFHITQPIALTWNEILDIYVQALQKYLKRNVNVLKTNKTTVYNFPGRKYQIIYCRYFNRKFNTTKINRYVDTKKFVSPSDGLARCIESFIRKPEFLNINWRLEAIHDRLTHENTPLNEITGLNNKITYTLHRYNLGFLHKILSILYMGINKQL